MKEKILLKTCQKNMKELGGTPDADAAVGLEPASGHAA